MEFRKPYTQLSVQKVFNEPSLTKQSFKDECDINRILDKYQRTGLIEFVNERQAQYDDFSGFDFAQSMNVVAKANEMFAALPAGVRKRFNNDPYEFVRFVDDPANTDEAVRIGLATKPAQTTPEPASQAQPMSGAVGQAEGAAGAA